MVKVMDLEMRDDSGEPILIHELLKANNIAVVRGRYHEGRKVRKMKCFWL